MSKLYDINHLSERQITRYTACVAQVTKNTVTSMYANVELFFLFVAYTPNWHFIHTQRDNYVRAVTVRLLSQATNPTAPYCYSFRKSFFILCISKCDSKSFKTVFYGHYYYCFTQLFSTQMIQSLICSPKQIIKRSETLTGQKK